MRYAVMKFDDRNRFGRNGVPATLLFAAGQQIVVYMKDETLQKAGKLNRFAKVIVTGDVSEGATSRAQAELGACEPRSTWGMHVSLTKFY